MRPDLTLTIIVGLLCLTLYLTKCTAYNQCTDDLTNERNYSAALDDTINTLTCANDALRDHVIADHDNLSDTNNRQDACQAALNSRALTTNSSPHNRVPPADVTLQDTTVTIAIPNVTQGFILPSGSMMPLLGANNTVLEITPTSPAAIYVGDIIIYEYADTRIIHRVIRLGQDKNGWYTILKGDNNPREDPDPIRFAQVRGIVVGVIY